MASRRSERLKEIAKDVRSILNSRKPPVSTSDILRDYKTILAVPLPYRELGYESPEQLLVDTGEFRINSMNGMTSIYALHESKASKHIKDMVLRQKKSKNAGKPLSKPRPPMHHVYIRSSSGGDRNNNYQMKVNYNVQQRQMMQPQKKPQPVKQQQQQMLQNSYNNSTTNGGGSNDYDLRMRLNRVQQQKQQEQQQKQQEQLQKQHEEQELRKQREAQEQQKRQQQQQNQMKTRPILGNGRQAAQQPTTPQQQQQSTAQKQHQKSMKNIQERLRVTTITESIQAQQYIKAPPLVEPKVISMPPILSANVFQFNTNWDPVTNLYQYCVVRQFAPPQYKSVHNRKTYSCRVQVNGYIYSTYPNEYNSEAEARLACAKIALDQIQQQETRKPLPVFMESDEKLVDKLYKELLKHNCGIFVKNVPECFESAYKQALPDHWWTLVQTSKYFITECLAGDKIVILANLQVSSTRQTPLKANVESKEHIKVELEQLKLPWDDKYWNVHVTYVESAVKVYVRLIGSEYSDQYDAVCKLIETSTKMPAKLVALNQIYLAFVSDGWHRVRVVELEESKERALCYYLDFGDTDWLPLINLFICDAKYLILPAQAVALSLFGLEDFQEHPSANAILYNHLQNNTLVAEILCKEFDYAREQRSVKAVLFDTTTDVDKNMNSIFLQMICDSMQAPELKSSGITKVNVTTINDDGTIFMRLQSAALTYVEKLISQIVASKFNRDQHSVNKLDLKRSDIFLICENVTSSGGTESRWYRGKLAHKQQTPPQLHTDDVLNIYYVDYGYSRTVHISQMFRLESLSQALSKFPVQAIKVQLHNIPEISKSIVGRMRALLPTNCEALVKLVQPAEVPLVTMYKRIEGPDTLCTINDTIRIEYELESSLETNTDFTGAAEVNSAHSSNASINKIEATNTTTPIQVSNNVPKTKIQNEDQNFKSDDDLKNLNVYNKIPPIGSFFDVRVALASNPTNFIVQPVLKYKELVALMKELQTYCQHAVNNVPLNKIQIGQAYAAKNPDGYYHRVIVEKIFNTDMIYVRYCDFGDTSVLRYTELKPLPEDFRHLPQMAIAAQLNDAQPIDGDWTMNDCTRFRELTVGKKFVGAVKGIKKKSHNDMLLELELIDVETEDDIYIKQVLQSENRLK